MNPPNIIFILADDHAAAAISCYSRRLIETPHLDRLAQEGARFDRCFCTNSICTPSRATLLTGKYPHVHGAITFNPPHPIHATFPQILRRHDYHTALIGKWHLFAEPVGFDYWNVLPGQGLYFNPEFVEMGRPRRISGYVTDILTDLSIDHLRRRPRDRPFCLLLHHKAPHDPWTTDARHAGLFAGSDLPEPPTLFDDYAGRAHAIRDTAQRIGSPHPSHTLYAAETGHIRDPRERLRAQYQIYIKSYLRVVASIDDNLGRLLAFLDTEGLSRDTLVIYTSDQGFFLGEHGWYDKRFMYEESLRMPLLMRLPGAIPAGITRNEMILNTDFAPTLLDYAGIPIPADLQGRSFRPLIEGHTPPDWRTSLYYRYYFSQMNTPAHWGLRTLRHKLINYHDSGEWELYDLQTDPLEMNNLYGRPEVAELTAALHAELELRREQAGDRESAADGRRRAEALLLKGHPDY